MCDVCVYHWFICLCCRCTVSVIFGPPDSAAWGGRQISCGLGVKAKWGRARSFSNRPLTLDSCGNEIAWLEATCVVFLFLFHLTRMQSLEVETSLQESWTEACKLTETHRRKCIGTQTPTCSKCWGTHHFFIVPFAFETHACFLSRSTDTDLTIFIRYFWMTASKLLVSCHPSREGCIQRGHSVLDKASRHTTLLPSSTPACPCTPAH